ncbi:MAG: sugar phosphate isomerase/epimerase [Clostridia bacterium]|nr:sugar phosphate isomerase/epimerase [Clostridia bacterium]
MKYSVSTYSFGRYASRGVPFMIDEAARLGFDGIEYCLDGEFSDGELRLFAKRARDAGIVPVCSCVGAEFLRCEDFDGECLGVEREVRRAALLGAPLLRHDVSNGYPGKLTDGDYEDAIPVLAAACRRITEYARGFGIATCTENHGYFSQDAKRVLKLYETVGDGNFGVLCDIGNFMCADADPVESTALVAPYAVHVHAKDFYFSRGKEPAGEGWFPTRNGGSLLGAVIGEGDARAAESMIVLRSAGYGGFVSVEFEGREDNLVGIARGLEFLTNVK